MATPKEIIDQYVIAVNNKYAIPQVTEEERQSVVLEFLRTRNLPDTNRSGVMLNFIRESLAFGGLVPESLARTYIDQVAAIGAANHSRRLSK